MEREKETEWISGSGLRGRIGGSGVPGKGRCGSVMLSLWLTVLSGWFSDEFESELESWIFCELGLGLLHKADRW